MTMKKLKWEEIIKLPSEEIAKRMTKDYRWKRYRFNTYSVDDWRPLVFNPEYPSWCSGYGENHTGEYAVIIAYLPNGEDLFKYWGDAFEIEFTEETEITFSDRFPRPSYFVE